MNIAITGANGFIGNNLFKFFIKNNINVIKLSRVKNSNGNFTNNFFFGTKNNHKLENIDTVIHCAARVHKFRENKYIAENLYKESNVFCTKKLAEEAIKKGVKKFIFLSSIKVNGEKTTESHLFNEKSKENPQDIYAKTKLEAEKVLLSLQENNQLKVIIIRPPLVYGPEVGANFRSMMWAINKGIPLPFKNNKNKRSFIFIDNLIAFIYECCINDSFKNKIFTISDNNDLSTSELIKKINFYMKKDGKQFCINKKVIKLFLKLFNKEKTYDKLFNSLQIDPIESFKEMNFIPPYSVDYGIKKTVSWYLKNQNKY